MGDERREGDIGWWKVTWGATRRLLRSRLALRMITVFLIGGALPLMIFGALAYVQVVAELESQTHRRLHQETKGVAMSIVERLLYLEAGLDLLLGSPRDPGGEATLGSGLRQLLERQFESVGIRAFGSEGPSRLLWGPALPSSVAPDRERAVEAGGSLIWMETADEERFPVVMMARRSEDGERWVWGRIHGSYLWDLGPRGSLPYQMELAVVDGEGRFLVRSAQVPDSLAPVLFQAAAQPRSSRGLEWDGGFGKHQGSFWVVPMATNYRTGPWVVALGIESSLAQEALARWRAVFPLSILLTLWVVLLLVVVQVRRSLDPLTALQRAVRQVGQGNFSTRVDLPTGDEFEDLARGFNRMAGRLGSQFETLSAITRLGRTAIARASDHTLLLAVLDSLRSSTGAETVAVALAGRTTIHIARSAPGLEPTVETSSRPVPSDDDGDAPWRSVISEVLPDPDRVCSVTVDGRRLGVLAASGPVPIDSAGLGELAEHVALVWRHRLLSDDLHRERTRLEELVEQLPHGVIVLDAEHRIVLANLLARNYLLDLSDAVPGQRLTHLGPMALVPPEAGEPVRWSDLSLPEPFRRIFVVAFSTMGPDRSVVLLRDVTQEREMQEELGQQERLAAVGRLAAGMAHDLNNTLQVVLSTTEMIHAESRSPTVREHAERVLDQSRHGSTLIRQMLDFSRRSPHRPEVLSLNRLVADHVTLFRHLVPRGVSLEAEIPDESLVVRADVTQIQQVLTNLVLNARDAMGEEGKIRIGIEACEHLPSDSAVRPTDAGSEAGWVALTVSDTGPGIPSEIQSRVFEPFFTTKELGRGSGLGLAQVHGIIEAHHGTIQLHSEPGRGTRFRILLPRSDEQLPETASPTLSPHRKTGKRILVVEDQEVVRMVLGIHLDTLGYKVETAVNGADAVQLMERIGGTIDLVISDVSMPKMNGKRLAAILHRTFPGLPVLLLTGYAEEEGPTLESLPGVTGLLQKPVTVERLAQAVEKALGGIRAQPSP